jgi:hypothetical protein
MNTKEKLKLDSEIHIRISSELGFLLKELAKNNNLKTSAAARLLLTNSIREYQLRNFNLTI